MDLAAEFFEFLSRHPRWGLLALVITIRGPAFIRTLAVQGRLALVERHERKLQWHLLNTPPVPHSPLFTYLELLNSHDCSGHPATGRDAPTVDATVTRAQASPSVDAVGIRRLLQALLRERGGT